MTLEEALWFLDWSLDQDGCVILRKGPRRVEDIIGIAQFIQWLGFTPLCFLPGSNVNLNWILEQSTDHRNLVFSLGPPLLGEAQLDSELAQDTGFLAPDKFKRAKAITDCVRSPTIPSVNILKTGFDDTLRRAWCLQNLVGSQSADGPFNEPERFDFHARLGVLMAHLHSHPVLMDPPLRAHAWYLGRVQRAVTWLVGRQFDETTGNRVRDATRRLLEIVDDGPTSIIHGDLMDHNMFVFSNPRQKTLLITGIIDWESCQWQGDPRAEALLTAWWAAGEHTDKADPRIFHQVLQHYHEANPPSPIDPDQLDPLLMLADLTWYVTVLPFTSLCEISRLEHRRASILKILEHVESRASYLPQGWEEPR